MVRSRLSDLVIPRCTIQDLVFGNLHLHGEKVALVDAHTGLSYTYKQLQQLSQNVASGLARLGVHKGDVVAVVSPNSPDFALMFYGLLQLGAVITTINPDYTSYEIQSQIRDCGASYIYTINNLVNKAKEAVQKIPSFKGIISNGGGSGCISFSQLLADDGRALPDLIDIDPWEDTAILAYSSGTTGLPKGVMLTHKTLVTNVLQLVHPKVMKPGKPMETGTDQHVVHGFLPFFHAYGFLTSLFESLYCGFMVVTMSKFIPDLFLQVIQQFKVTVLPIVPPVVVFLVNSPLVSKYDLSTLRFIRCSAAPLDGDTETAFRKLFPSADVCQTYGMSEGILFCHSTQECKAIGSVGEVLPNLEIKISDLDTSEELGFGKRGEVWFRGTPFMKGYLNKPEETKKMIDADGWLHTGDVGYLDDKGNLFVVDRIKELIKVRGFQVAPAELEALLLTHPGVKDIAVVGVPDERSGDVPRAYVVRTAKSHVTADELYKFVEGRVVGYKKLDGGIEFVDTIPKSPSGKILRRQLREHARARTAKL